MYVGGRADVERGAQLGCPHEIIVYEAVGRASASQGPHVWALCPAWSPRVSQAAQHIIYVAVRALARP